MKNYKIKQISNVNLFEGLPYIGYESYVKKGKQPSNEKHNLS